MKLNNRLARIERALGRRADDRIPVICVDWTENPVICVDADGKRSSAQHSSASGVDYRRDLWMVADETQ